MSEDEELELLDMEGAGFIDASVEFCRLLRDVEDAVSSECATTIIANAGRMSDFMVLIMM